MKTTPPPAAPPATAGAAPSTAARVSDRLTESLVDPPPGKRPGPAQRRDGWTPDRIRSFLGTLAQCGVVADAARAAGMSVQSAYALRNRAAGRAFHLAWNAALQLARRRIADAVMSRAIHGCVDLIVRDGEIWGERHRYDNRLTMAVLTRLDRQVLSDDDESEDSRLVAEEFEEFLDLVSDGGDGADRFIAARRKAERRYAPSREARLLRRLESYRRSRAGMPDGQDPASGEAGPDDSGHAAVAALFERLGDLAAGEAGEDPQQP
jgi:hypothetical protein